MISIRDLFVVALLGMGIGFALPACVASHHHRNMIDIFAP